MKKSLLKAIEETVKLSTDHPDTLYRVMDRVGKKAVVASCEWTYRERVFEDYYTVKMYKGGVEV